MVNSIKPVISIWVPYRSIDKVSRMEVDNLSWYQSDPNSNKVVEGFDEGNDWVNVFIPFDYFIRLKDNQGKLENLAKDLQI